MAANATRDNAAQVTAGLQDFLQRVAHVMLAGFPAVRRWDETEDISQQAASRLFVALQTVQPRSQRHLENLAAVQVRRTLIERARQYARSLEQGRDRWTPNSARGDVRPLLQRTANDPEDAVDLRRWTELHTAVRDMDPDAQEVFQLIWYRGHSRVAVAELLDVDVRTVQRRWRAAREYLAHRLDRRLLESHDF